MSRTAHRLFSSPLRFSTRVNLNAAARSSRSTLTRRMVSSESHGSHSSAPSDKVWIIGSALVFGPLFLYLVSPSARKGSHGHTDHGHHDKHEDKHVQHGSRPEVDAAPIADDEGTEVAAQEVEESIEKAFEADSPKDAQEHEQVVATTVKKDSATEVHSQAEPSTDVPLAPESVPNAEAGHSAGDGETQGTVGDGAASKSAAETKL